MSKSKLTSLAHRYFAIMSFSEAALPPYISGPPLAWMLAIVFTTVIITLGFPHITVAVPSMLVAIAFGMFLEYAFNLGMCLMSLKLTWWGTITVGDHSEFGGELPKFFTPYIPVTMDSMAIIFRYSAIISGIALLQTLMTLQACWFEMKLTLSGHQQPDQHPGPTKSWMCYSRARKYFMWNVC